MGHWERICGLCVAIYLEDSSSILSAGTLQTRRGNVQSLRRKLALHGHLDPLCLDAEMSAIGLDEISLCVFRAVRNALCFVNLASYLLFPDCQMLEDRLRQASYSLRQFACRICGAAPSFWGLLVGFLFFGRLRARLTSLIWALVLVCSI